MKLKKFFFEGPIEYSGHVFQTDRLADSTKATDVTHGLQHPRNDTQIKSFLVFATYLIDLYQTWSA